MSLSTEWIRIDAIWHKCDYHWMYGSLNASGQRAHTIWIGRLVIAHNNNLCSVCITPHIQSLITVCSPFSFFYFYVILFDISVSPESIVIPIVSCIFGFPLLALLVICCLRRRAKLARERDRRRNYDLQDHAVSLVRFSPIHRLCESKMPIGKFKFIFDFRFFCLFIVSANWLNFTFDKNRLFRMKWFTKNIEK